MRAVFTVPVVTVGCDARYTDAGPGRLHLNVCVCERIESIAGRSRKGTVECARDRALNYREAGSSKNEDRVGRSRNEDRVGRRQSVEQGAHSQQQWQPLEDGRWGRVIGREGAER